MPHHAALPRSCSTPVKGVVSRRCPSRSEAEMRHRREHPTRPRMGRWRARSASSEVGPSKRSGEGEGSQATERSDSRMGDRRGVGRADHRARFRPSEARGGNAARCHLPLCSLTLLRQFRASARKRLQICCLIGEKGRYLTPRYLAGIRRTQRVVRYLGYPFCPESRGSTGTGV